MGTTPGGTAKRTLVGRAVANLAQRPLKQLATWVAAAGVVISAPFGGWADATEPPPPVLKPKTVIHTGPIDITLERITSSTRPGRGFLEAKDGQYLLVIGTVRNPGKVTLTNLELRDAVRLQGVGGLEKYSGVGNWLTAEDSTSAQPAVYNAADATALIDLVPELTYEVAWIFQRQGDAAPSSITVEVRSFTYRQRSVDDYTGWLDPTEMGTVRLPVTVKEPYVSPSAP